MKDNFNACLKATLKWEGGFVNHPLDRGGATNLGITQKTLSNYLGRPASIDDVKALTHDAVKPIYREYWDAIAGERLPAGLDLMAFDMCVNSGPKPAVRALQRAVKVPADGVFGPRTLAAALKADKMAIKGYAFWRRDFFRSIVESRRSQEVFLRGWLNRIDDIEQTALKMAG